MTKTTVQNCNASSHRAGRTSSRRTLALGKSFNDFQTQRISQASLWSMGFYSGRHDHQKLTAIAQDLRLNTNFYDHEHAKSIMLKELSVQANYNAISLMT